jgi:hypothetical protein
MLGPVTNLLRLQLRILANNRPACLVLVCLVGAALVPLPRRALPPPDTCYVAYWQEDAWIERLKSEVDQRAPDQPLIEVVPAEHFADADGVIRYPPGAHSIQIRPPDGTHDHWVIWCWYSGSDPSVLDESAAWFWKVTRHHFPDALPVEVKYSPLQPQLALPRDLTDAWIPLTGGTRLWSFALWMTLVFCGCYLPALSLAQQHENRTIVYLATAPIGWWRAVLVTIFFYAALAIPVAMLVAQQAQSGLALGPLVLLGTVAYLGVGLCIGCCARTTASASGGVILYSLVGGAIAVGSHYTSFALEPVLRAFSIEANLFSSLRNVEGDRTLVGLSGLLLSAILWQMLAYLSCWFRRRQGV